MRHFAFFTALAALFVGIAHPAMADKAAEGKIKARQGYYQLVVNNAGQLFGMAKGEIDYDAAQATTAANNLKILTTLETGGLWAAGTSKEEMPGKTRALKKIWDTYPAIGEKLDAFKKAVDAMAANAGNGLDALRANAGALGGACKSCHDDFRAEKF